jgi:hypothetical protein
MWVMVVVIMLMWVVVVVVVVMKVVSTHVIQICDILIVHTQNGH